MKDVVFEIEEKFPDARNIQINGIKVWPFIRIMFRYMVVENELKRTNRSNYQNKIAESFWYRIQRRVIPNLTKWFKKYKVVIFSNDYEKRLLNGKYIDKLSEGIVNQLNPGESLTINYFSEINIPVNSLNNEYSVDGLIMGRLTRFAMGFTKVSVDESHKRLLNEILDEYELKWSDLELRIRGMFAQVYIIKKILRLLKPKFVITSCYSSFPEILASKQSKIRTIELQHGIVSPLHPGYESRFDLNKDFTADNLFVFGSNSIMGLDNNIVNTKNSFVVGNYYLERLKAEPKNGKILDMISGYSISVCVPTDYLTEDEILEFIINVAKQKPEIIFLITPRTNLSDAVKRLISEIANVQLTRDFAFQDVVRHCTFHTATNSTCCLEALFFGTCNILIDKNGSVKDIFGALTSENFTKFVSSPKEYIEIINNWNQIDRNTVKESNRDNFANNYESNLKGALQKIGII